MDNLELQEIKNLTKEKIAVSNFQKGTNMKNKRNTSRLFLIKTFGTVAVCLMLSCGIIFSKQLSKQVYNSYMASREVEIELNNARTAKFDADYTVSDEEIIDLDNNNQGFSQESIKINVEDITMDDNNFNVTFDINLSDEIAKKIDHTKNLDVSFTDLFITDENENVLFSLDKQRVYEYLKIDIMSGYSTDLGVDIEQYQKNILTENEHFFDGSLNYFVLEHKGNNIKVIYNMNLVGQSKYYPRSKKLNFNIGKIQIINDKENIYGGSYFNFKGNWDFTLDLPEKIYNRKIYQYSEVSNKYDEENKVLLCNVLDSGTEVKLSLKAFEISHESPQLKLINAMEIENPTVQIRDWFVDELMASEEYEKYSEDLFKLYYIQNAYIENENGKKYELSRGAFSNGGGTMTEDNYYEPSLIFDLTTKNMTDNLTLHLTYLDTKYEFNLVKEAEL